MTTKKVLIGCGIAAIILLMIIAGGALYVYRQIVPGLKGASQVPSALVHPGVVKGSGFLSKTEFAAVPGLGNVTDIAFGKLDPAPRVEIAFAGGTGAAFVDKGGNVKSSVSYGTAGVSSDDMSILRGNGACQFMRRGSWGSRPALLDHAGAVLWEYKGTSAADDMVAGDINGDGLLEFAVGLNGGGGVDLLDSRGQKLWNKPDGNVWHVEMADANGDGQLEIIHTNAGGVIKVRDAYGNVISESSTPVYCSDFSLCRWPTKKDREQVLVSDQGGIWLLNYNGATVKRFDAPGCPDQGAARGIAVSLKSGKPECFAALVTFENARRSVLYVYDPAGKLVYQEVLPEASASIAAISLDNSGAESILIGGEGHVTRYSVLASAHGK